MPYTQQWGISRNAFQSPLKQDEETTLDPHFNWDTWKGNVDDLSDAEWDARNQFNYYKSQGKDPFSDEYKDVHTKFMSKYRTEDVDLKPEVDITEAADNDIIEQNNENAELETSKDIFDKAPVVSKKLTTIGGPEWEARQNEGFETDSAWKQVGTLLKNPFQGINALMQQTRVGAQNLIGNEISTVGPTSSLTNLRRAKEAKKAGADIYIPGEEMNMASQWIPPAVVAGSAHQAFTGGGQMVTGNFSKGARNIAGGLYSYIPGLNKIKGGNTLVNKSLRSVDKVTGSNFKNIGPKVQSFLSNTADKISKSNIGEKFWNILDKGGTYAFKGLKATEQSRNLSP
jgi:hypothetical protein